MTPPSVCYTTRLLTPDTWDDFAALVEANNGVWGGCWCIGFHPEGITKDSTASGNREAKRAHVNNGTSHQMLVYRDDACVGWCQYGSPAEVATIKHPKAYEKDLVKLPSSRRYAMAAASLPGGTGPGHDRLRHSEPTVPLWERHFGLGTDGDRRVADES